MILISMPLSKLATISSGGGAPQDATAFSTTGIPFIRAGSLPKLLLGEKEDSLELIKPDVADQYGLKIFPAGTVVFAKSGMSATKGHVYELKNSAYIVNHLAALIPFEPEDSAFLVRALQKFSPKNLIKGLGYPSISLSDIEKMRIRAPTCINERIKIAKILDKTDALRVKRLATLSLLDTLTQSIFLEMFGSPVVNPKKWPKKIFSEICETRLGKMLDQKQQTGEHLRPYMRNANVQWFRFDLSSVFEMDFDDDDRRKFRLQFGDLLICEGGEPGRAAIWRNELEDCYFQKALHRARPNPNLATAEFLSWLLWFLTQSEMISGVTSATIAHLTGEKLAILPIMLPPLSHQQKFTNYCIFIDKMRSRLQTSLNQLDQLFATLQNRAFRGEL